MVNAREVKCYVCKVSFRTKLLNKKFCNDLCASKNWQIKTGREGNSRNGVSSHSVGAMAELNVSSYFLNLGYAVFRSLSPSCFCDLIIIKDNKIERVEVRTGYKGDKGQLTFNKKRHGEIDLFAIWIQKTGEIILKNSNEVEYKSKTTNS